jgi:hypothetical protein
MLIHLLFRIYLFIYSSQFLSHGERLFTYHPHWHCKSSFWLCNVAKQQRKGICSGLRLKSTLSDLYVILSDKYADILSITHTNIFLTIHTYIYIYIYTYQHTCACSRWIPDHIYSRSHQNGSYIRADGGRPDGSEDCSLLQSKCWHLAIKWCC